MFVHAVEPPGAEPVARVGRRAVGAVGHQLPNPS